ncbi:MAG: phosphoesterase [Candidatus Dormibacteraeota bacterium]|nr:phosphoesterase [Candidatus Dormibacteraeota bacterium]
MRVVRVRSDFAVHRRARVALAVGGALGAVVATVVPNAVSAAPGSSTTTPIKHVVVIIGENHSFDNVFATYQPPKGQSVMNLLSEGIINTTGGAGPNAAVAQQQQATDTSTFSVSPTETGAYATLPQPNTTYVSPACDGQPGNQPDTRFPANLANVPYQITNYVPYLDNHGEYSGTCEFYGAMVGDPLHRYYQMQQQYGQGTGALNVWTANTAGDDNGAIPPAPIHQGALQMGYYNVAQGDASVFDYLAQHYAMSDNYHQAVMGGTGANHIALGTGDAAFYSDGHGNPLVPPSNQIENPNPKPGTNNNFTQDGYAGGSYSNCSDPGQPGVAAVFAHDAGHTLFNSGDCAPGAYYLLNNYNPGYTVTGALNTSSPFTVPPQSFNTIADELQAKGISWGYFGEGYNNGTPTGGYCGICDPFQYATSVMTDPAKRVNTQHDSSDFDKDVSGSTLPSVSFLKPGDDDGHPGYSTLAAFENFVSHTITEIQNKPSLWKNTAVIVTEDESGGYYDSGYIQPTSFFGDGPRVPLMVVSPYTKPGHIDHTYDDHVSILKFIEANWKLPTLSSRSLDNLPDPTTTTKDGYVPANGPAIGDLMSLFDFRHARDDMATPPQDQGGNQQGQPVAHADLNR